MTILVSTLTNDNPGHYTDQWQSRSIHWPMTILAITLTNNNPNHGHHTDQWQSLLAITLTNDNPGHYTDRWQSWTSHWPMTITPGHHTDQWQSWPLHRPMTITLNLTLSQGVGQFLTFFNQIDKIGLRNYRFKIHLVQGLWEKLFKLFSWIQI